MLQSILQQIGLTRGESQVYLTLLKTGNTTSGALIKHSGVSRSKVYEVLERLKQKGLVTEMIKQNVKYFEATNPQRILTYLKKQERILHRNERQANKLIPALMRLQHLHQEKQEAKVYSGIEGWKTLYQEILDVLRQGEEYLAFGIGQDELQDKRIERFFRTFHLQRAEKHIRARLIMHPSTRRIMQKKFSDLKYYTYRFLDSEFPTNINIHKDNTVTLVWGERPVAFVISSKEVTDKYRRYFEHLWRQAKP